MRIDIGKPAVCAGVLRLTLFFILQIIIICELWYLDMEPLLIAYGTRSAVEGFRPNPKERT